MTTESGILTPRPYARLLTMLSDQLIKNNTVALTELAKNSYDADASWVQIRIGNMKNFGKAGLSEPEKPFVEIEDDGDGMSFEVVRDSWMNPATPNKFQRRLAKTRKKRFLQGEKGIGRYAVFQIGKRVEIYTREKTGDNVGGREVTLITDLSRYEDELLGDKTAASPQEPLFFDQLHSEYFVREEPVCIKPHPLVIDDAAEVSKNHGTLIRITELNYKWTDSNVRKIRETLSYLQSPFSKTDFAISIVYESKEVQAFEERNIKDVLDEAALKMEGTVHADGTCDYTLDDSKGTIDLVKNLESDAVSENREHFSVDHQPECGPFAFKFYVYNLTTINDDELKRYIRAHRTYIYRDDIRIYPYGDKDNDWLKIDIYRGITKAGAYLSNDQLIGYISISSKGNPALRDKTNREGVLEQGPAYEDLRFLTLSVLDFLHAEFQKLRAPKANRLKRRTTDLYLQTERVKERINALGRYLDKNKDDEGRSLLNQLAQDYYQERDIYQRQIEIVEDLAGVGIAVDATSHDVMVVMNRAVEKINEIQTLLNSGNLDHSRLKEKADALEEQITFMRSLLVGIQPLFRSSRRKKRELLIENIVTTVIRYYETPLKNLNVKVEIHPIGSPLILKSSEGVLLQLFINLMDNAVYWIKVSRTQDPKIKVLIDGDKGYAVFADNGPGVRKEDIDYIFEPFFSRKGLEGRGLGLYIARQLADKYGYDLYYIEEKAAQILPGANFRIDFFQREE